MLEFIIGFALSLTALSVVVAVLDRQTKVMDKEKEENEEK